jgi:lipopolysaccharide biosynthesis glycosyltransferase
MLNSKIILNNYHSLEENLPFLSFYTTLNSLVLINKKSIQTIEKVIYNIPLESTETFHLESNNSINVLELWNFGTPPNHGEGLTNFVYSVDKKYLVGFFASCNSLLKNINSEDIIKNVRINIIIPSIDYDHFRIQFINFLEKVPFKPEFSIYLVNKKMIDEPFVKTKCFKGGNHLLNIGNFSRLLIGKLFGVSKVLYLDSDTIIQSDLFKLVSETELGEQIIAGKRSEQNLKTIVNEIYINNLQEFLGHPINLERNIIYTGTLLINPIKLNFYFSNIIHIVSLHNNLTNGLYKLFTMSIINLAFYRNIGYLDEKICNMVDLGSKKKSYSPKLLEQADILDWSGLYKPWYKNGLYQELWDKYDVLKYKKNKLKLVNKNTIEIGIN